MTFAQPDFHILPYQPRSYFITGQITIGGIVTAFLGMLSKIR